MGDKRDTIDEAPLDALLRRMLLLCTRDFGVRQDQVDCAELLLAAGYRSSARLLYDIVFLRDGFSDQSIYNQSRIAERTGLWPNLESHPSAVYSDPGHVTELAIADMRNWMAAPQAEDEAVDPPARQAGELEALCEELCDALRQSSEPESLGGLLLAARSAALDTAIPLQEDMIGSITVVTETVARNNLRHFLLSNYDLAFAPIGSSGLLHAAARSHPAGLGAYGRNVPAIVGNGRQLLGLIQLGRGAPATAGFEIWTETWAAVLCTRLTGGSLHDATEELGDHGYLRALGAILAHALRDPSARPDRQLLMRVRDAGLDNDDLQLAWNAQQALARWWSDDKHEWLALGDILAYRGRYDESCAAFRTALRLDPDDGHASASVRALEAGDFGRLRNQGGFGTPEHRRTIRAERHRNGLSAQYDYSAEIPRLDEPDIFERLAPELAPREPADPLYRYDSNRPLQIRRLGARRARSRWGLLPLLRGVEAIRGVCISATAFSEVRISIGDRTLYRGAPASFSLPNAEAGERKYVFNVWLDLSHLPRGRHAVTVSLIDIAGNACQHHEHVLIAAPLTEAEAPASDGLVAPPESSNLPLDSAINARSSMVRQADRRLFDRPPQTILVIRADQLGDLVCSVSALRRLRELFPAARLTGLLTPANAPLAASLGLFDDVVTVDFPEDPSERRRVMPLDRQEALRARLEPYRFDLAIDLSYNPPARPLLLLSGARFLYGCRGRDFSYLDLGFEAPSHDPVNGSENVPAAAKILAMVEWLGIAMGSAKPALQRSAVSRDSLAPYGLVEQRYAVLHSGARLAFSRWPYFHELASLIMNNTDLHVVLIGDELSGPLPDSERLHILGEGLAFDTLDALLSFSAVFVGNDSGPKHLASLRGVPVVGIHCARNNWNEWGHQTGGLIISRRVPCAGCQIHHDPEDCGKEIACITHIRPHEVYTAVARLLQS